jgi:uncharacterized protein (TIGR02118 family)
MPGWWSWPESTSFATDNRIAVCQTLGMIVMTILYPRTDDSNFDMDYYNSSHMPMVADALGDDCQGWGSATMADGNWAAMGWVVASSQEAMNAAMAEHGAKIMGDVPNYTNVQPEVLMGQIAGGSQ